MSRLTDLTDSLTRWFLGFWIRQYRISYLIVLALFVMGMISLVSIKKESSPAVTFGMVMVSVAYPGTSPVDIDSLITDKIYKEIKDIKGIDKIDASSTLGFSMTTITLKTDANTKDVINDVRNSIGRIAFPTDAKTPVVTELQTDTDRAFSIYLYAKNDTISGDALRSKAYDLKERLEKVSGVDAVKFEWGADYDLEIILDADKLATLGLSIDGVASTIKSWNRDMPVGSYTISDKKYDFRIEGKYTDALRLLSIPIILSNGDSIQLGDLSTIRRKYKDESRREIAINGTGGWVESLTPNPSPAGRGEWYNREHSWTGGISLSSQSEENPQSPPSSSTAPLRKEPQDWWVENPPLTLWRYVSLTVDKSDSASIFSASNAAKAVVEEMMKKPEYQGIGFVYGMDLADNIRDDYHELMQEALTTLGLVFFAMFLFVGFRDSLFATMTLPLAFLATFIGLYYGGYTLNFLTNFSLILSFGIAVDTIIVIVQAASAKIRVGYTPRTAIMLALREYAVPIISGVSTTIVVFIPMMALPGIVGKFLAYIPITIFFVLAFGLILVLTVNSALYLLFVKGRDTYVDDPNALKYATEEEKEILKLEREGKRSIAEARAPLRIRIIHRVTEAYKHALGWYLRDTFLRRLLIFLPIVLLILSFFFLAPRVGVNIFPSDDKGLITFSITAPKGQTTDVTYEETARVRTVFARYPEVEYATIVTQDNISTITVQLTKKAVRESLHQRSVFDLEPLLSKELDPYRARGLRVESVVAKNGPPWEKAVGLKLIASSSEELPTLIRVSKDFEKYLKTIKGTKNVGTSSEDTPWQFILALDREKIATLGLSPALIYAQIALSMNGQAVGSIEERGEDMDIVLKSSQFADGVNMQDVLGIPIVMGNSRYVVGDFIDVTLKNAIASVARKDGKLQITVGSDLETGVDSASTQAQFSAFAQKYVFPAGISYEVGGENQANQELIQALLSAFFLSIIVIFAILTLQFDSFAQPAVVLYSVVMSLPMVMTGLLLTGNQFSLPFGIGFIAFTGIAVNHGIILIDAINQNLKKGMEWVKALIEAGSSRLEPMLLTTLTTVLGILPIALRDLFWAGMGFTIIFGIMSTTFLTLFVVKGIYYELFLRKREGGVEKERREEEEK